MRSLESAILICATAILPVTAQQRLFTAADYQRAEKFMAYNTTPLVTHAAGRVTWLADDRFWYRTTTVDGTAFVIVDAARGTSTPAFDHAKLATSFSKAASKEYRGDRLPFDEIVARIPSDTDVIGVSCMFSNAWYPTRDLLVAIRARLPQAWIVLGGEHATACASHVLETCAAVDACVLGEGEHTMLALLACLESGGEAAAVAGVAARRDGRVPRGGRDLVKSLRGPRIAALDGIPRPAWDLFPIERYIAGQFNHGVVRGRTMPILASRGCPYQCTFCSSPAMWTTKWSARRPERAGSFRGGAPARPPPAPPAPEDTPAPEAPAPDVPASAAPAPAAAPTIDQLHPTGIQGDQVGFTPTTDQMRNAQMIIQEGQALGLPARAWVIAVATSLQESTLTNYGDLGMSNDHDSLGLFQQRPSSGWGTVAQLTDPAYAARAFYQVLIQYTGDWGCLTCAAQPCRSVCSHGLPIERLTAPTHRMLKS